MSDDIVTRLRGEFLARWVMTSDELPILREAVDEIERLREKVDDLLAYAEQDSCAIENLREQVKAAHKILGSESFGWLVIGSNHEVSHWEILSPYIDAYWDKYGTYFRPKPNDADS